MICEKSYRQEEGCVGKRPVGGHHTSSCFFLSLLDTMLLTPATTVEGLDAATIVRPRSQREHRDRGEARSIADQVSETVLRL